MKTANWDAIKEVAVRHGVSRKFFSGDRATVSLNTFVPGHEVRPHRHDSEQIVYVLTGTVKFHVDGEETILTSGGLLTVPSGVEHFAEVVGEDIVQNLAIFIPRRDDFEV